MSILRISLLASTFYILCVFFFDDETKISFHKLYKCGPENAQKLESNLIKIHDSSGKIVSRGFSFIPNLRFDRRNLYSKEQIFPSRFLRLKENDSYEFFSNNILIQIGVQ